MFNPYISPEEMSNSDTVILPAHLYMLKGLLRQKIYLPKTMSEHVPPALAGNV